MALWMCSKCGAQAVGDPVLVVTTMSSHKCPAPEPKPKTK